MTAVAWRTSAGTAARLPVARATNLTRTLREYATAGLMIAGLDAEGSVSLDEFELATDPLVLVVGSEGKGLSPAGPPDLRRDGVDPDGRAGRVAERVGGRGRRAGRGRAAAAARTPGDDPLGRPPAATSRNAIAAT